MGLDRQMGRELTLDCHTGRMTTFFVMALKRLILRLLLGHTERLVVTLEQQALLDLPAGQRLPLWEAEVPLWAQPI
jgi:hypothetical protein